MKLTCAFNLLTHLAAVNASWSTVELRNLCIKSCCMLVVIALICGGTFWVIHWFAIIACYDCTEARTMAALCNKLHSMQRYTWLFSSYEWMISVVNVCCVWLCRFIAVFIPAWTFDSYEQQTAHAYSWGVLLVISSLWSAGWSMLEWSSSRTDARTVVAMATPLPEFRRRSSAFFPLLFLCAAPCLSVRTNLKREKKPIAWLLFDFA